MKARNIGYPSPKTVNGRGLLSIFEPRRCYSHTVYTAVGIILYLVAEWIHFTHFGIMLPTIKLKVYTFGGLMNSAPKYMRNAFIVYCKLDLRVVSSWINAYPPMSGTELDQ